MATIKVTIDQFGQPKIEALGFVGATCEKATADLEAAFSRGADAVKKDRKPGQGIGQAAVAKATVGQ